MAVLGEMQPDVQVLSGPHWLLMQSALVLQTVPSVFRHLLEVGLSAWPVGQAQALVACLID